MSLSSYRLDECEGKLRKTATELKFYTDMFSAMHNKLQVMHGTECLSYDDFLYLFNRGMREDHQSISDCVDTLTMTCKIVFGEDLEIIKTNSRKLVEQRAQYYKQLSIDIIRATDEFNKLVSERQLEKNKEIEYSRGLLDIIKNGRFKLFDFSESDQEMIEILRENGNISATAFSHILKTRSYKNIPPRKNDDYYQVKNHKRHPDNLPNRHY